MNEPTHPPTPREPKIEHPAAVNVYAENELVGEFEENGRRFRRFERNGDGDLQVEWLV